MFSGGRFHLSLAAFAVGVGLAALPVASAVAQDKKPNIVVIMGDDIGMWNIGAYHRGMMAGTTPNLDKIAKQGMLFTDYYAEASCTAGRANFIMGELPIRTGMTTVGQAGASIGIPAEAVTIATVLKSMGYATGQFGKNHLGDKNEFLPTVHGFDEFFGYLYHLDAMEDPAHPNYPQNLLNVVGPRNMVHSWATDVDDPTEQPRWGKIGKQRIEDAGPLYPKRMETVDDEIRDSRHRFHRQGEEGRQAVLRLAQPDADAYRHASLAEIRGAAQCGERLVGRRSRHGAARRRRRAGDEETGRPGGRRQHHRPLHHRQRHRGLHLARRRPDAVRPVQGNGARGRIPGAGAASLAGPCAGRLRAERHLLRPRLAADLRGDRRRSEHHRRIAEGQDDRRPDLQEPSRRLRPDWPRSPARDRPIATKSSISAKARSARCASTTTSTASSTSRTAGSARRRIRTFPTSPTSASIRSSAPAGRTTEQRTAPSNTSTGSSSSSGVSCSSSS